MQLIKNSTRKAGSIHLALAAASASLLGGVNAHADENPWLVDSAVLIYNESAGRVSAIEPVVSLKKDMGDEHFLGLKFTYDALTGASPNGAIPSKQTITYTGTSGRSNYTTTIGKMPVANFEDQRSAFGLSWDQPLGDNYHFSIGGNYSHENDFQSNGFNAAIARDFNDKNTTISLGANLEADSSNAIGGIPYAFSATSDTSRVANSENKNVHDILFGISQVMSRDWLTQLNYSHSTSSGYQNDPYKILSVLNTNGTAIDDPNNNSSLWLHENRPTDRARQSIYWSNKIHITDMDIVDLSFRHYWDDWGIKSETFDIRYRIEIGESSYLEPHYRFYTQNAADFYRPFLVSGTDVVNGVSTLDYASSDPRLAKFTGSTFGLKWGYEISRNSEFNVRVEQYKQIGKSVPDAAKNMSALDGLNLYPGLSTQTIMIGYSFEF
jgi:hypothetical protein